MRLLLLQVSLRVPRLLRLPFFLLVVLSLILQYSALRVSKCKSAVALWFMLFLLLLVHMVQLLLGLLRVLVLLLLQRFGEFLFGVLQCSVWRATRSV